MFSSFYNQATAAINRNKQPQNSSHHGFKNAMNMEWMMNKEQVRPKTLFYVGSVTNRGFGSFNIFLRFFYHQQLTINKYAK